MAPILISLALVGATLRVSPLTQKAGGFWGKQNQRKVEGALEEGEEEHVMEKFSAVGDEGLESFTQLSPRTRELEERLSVHPHLLFTGSSLGQKKQKKQRQANAMLKGTRKDMRWYLGVVG